MEKLMNGNDESAKQQVERVDKALDEYERSQGLPKLVPHNEAETYLNMSRGEMHKMYPDDCGEAAVILAQYAFHIQRACNEELARMNWAEDMIKKTIAYEISQYKAASYEERKIQAVNGNDFTSKLDKIRIWAKARYDRIAYLSSKIEFLAQTFRDLQQTKRRQTNA